MKVKRLLLLGLLAAGGVYLSVVGLAYAFQRALLFPAPGGARPPTLQAGETAMSIVGPSGGPAHAVWMPGPPGSPTIVHFHGNGEDLRDAVLLGRLLRQQGFSFYAVEYPGYGPAADQAASEAAIYEAAEAAIRHLIERVGVARDGFVIMGHSLGTGVAVEMATRGYGGQLALIAPYTSIPDVAARSFWFLPVRTLLKDRFDTARKAAQIGLPVLIVHGDDDAVVPVQMGRRLAELFAHATYREVDASHSDVFARHTAAVSDWLHELTRAERASSIVP